MFWENTSAARGAQPAQRDPAHLCNGDPVLTLPDGREVYLPARRGWPDFPGEPGGNLARCRGPAMIEAVPTSGAPMRLTDNTEVIDAVLKALEQHHGWTREANGGGGIRRAGVGDAADAGVGRARGTPSASGCSGSRAARASVAGAEWSAGAGPGSASRGALDYVPRSSASTSALRGDRLGAAVVEPRQAHGVAGEHEPTDSAHAHDRRATARSARRTASRCRPGRGDPDHASGGAGLLGALACAGVDVDADQRTAALVVCARAPPGQPAPSSTMSARPRPARVRAIRSGARWICRTAASDLPWRGGDPPVDVRRPRPAGRSARRATSAVWRAGRLVDARPVRCAARRAKCRPRPQPRAALRRR